MQLNEIGGYQLLEVIGQGGQGTVYRAHDPSSGQIVAVKVLASNQGDGEFLERFHREASILATVNHPNIVTVLTRARKMVATISRLNLFRRTLVEFLKEVGNYPFNESWQLPLNFLPHLAFLILMA